MFRWNLSQPVSPVRVGGIHWFAGSIQASTVILAAVIFLIAGTARSEDLMILQEQDRQEASGTRDRADLLFQELRDKLTAAKREKRPVDAKREAEEVIRLYQSVTHRFPLTEISAYCEGQLAGVYQQIGEYDAGVRSLAAAYELYADTPEAGHLAFGVGLMLLQAKNDPETAIKWLELIPAPKESESMEAQAALGKYISAQQSAIKCEILLSRLDDAASRVTRMAQAYPQFQTEIERGYEFEVRAAKSSTRRRLEPQPASNEVASQNPLPPKRLPAAAPDSKAIAHPLLEPQVRQLRTVKPGPEMDALVQELAKHRDPAVDEIERLCPELAGDFGWVHTSVRVLEQVNSQKSRAVLKKLALGEIPVPKENLQSWAAGALLRCDPNLARTLLSSSTDEVLQTAISGLREQHIDDALMKDLSPHLQSTNPRLRYLAALMMSRGPSAQAWSAVLTAIRKVDEIPNLDEIDPSTGYGSIRMTVREANLSRFFPLIERVGVNNFAIWEASKDLPGRTRDTVLLGLAFRGEASVHNEIVRIANDPDAGMFRGWAASALEQIGTSEDLPLLRKLAESDPLIREGGGNAIRLRAGDGPYYPVRWMAKQTIIVIERRMQTEAR